MATFDEVKATHGSATTTRVTCCGCKKTYICAGKHRGKKLDCECGSSTKI